jgi:hypothetical protein
MALMSEVTQAFPPGTQVRVTREVQDLSRIGISQSHATRAVGFEFEVEDFVSAEDAEDGVAFYWGNADGGFNNVTVPADAVELVRTVEQQNARMLPSREELISFLGSTLLSDCGFFSINETNRDGEAAMEVFGETAEGLTFGFRLHVSPTWGTDV